MSAPAPLDVLRSLRDVGDLLGSFVVSDFGEVVVRDVPAIFDDETLDESATRLVRLRETLDGTDDPMEHALLDYGEHKLFLRAFTGATLVVLAPRGVNVPSLRMAATLVARKLERSLGAYPTAPQPAAAPPISAPPAEGVVDPADPDRPADSGGSARGRTATASAAHDVGAADAARATARVFARGSQANLSGRSDRVSLLIFPIGPEADISPKQRKEKLVQSRKDAVTASTSRRACSCSLAG